ncbi:MAG: hypothetical protein AVO35_09215 [Candidatus Aegiribacteria sp. MLS_C]|nr:MAG: hypothetical protein AVO35_09215 [Candidatus Aegiribacteria sp. MLS_C]
MHEWGVIELDLSFPEARGARWGYLRPNGILEPWTEYEVEAPVIWFHGAPCTGTLTISSEQGYFTTMLPRPDTLWDGEGERMAYPAAAGSQTAVWRDVRVRYGGFEAEEELLPVDSDPGGFGWAIPFWRRVDSNTITVPGSSYLDTFIYYECTAGDIPGIVNDGPGGEDAWGYTGEALLFAPSGEEVTASLVTVDGTPEEVRRDLSRSDILSVICNWGGDLKSIEILALWETWEPAVRQRCVMGGEKVLIFPLTAEQTESVSRITFEPEDDQPVEYARLFLAMGAIGFI